MLLAIQPAIVPYLLHFLLVSFVIALVTSAVRLRDPGKIGSETIRFFVTIVVSIILFGALVAVLEWLFIRPLI